MEHDLRYRTAASLNLLMDCADRGDAPWWREEELAEILLHQLEAPLVFDLRQLENLEPATGKGGADDALPDKFSALLFGENPPLPLLRLMKEFAKSSDKRSNNPLPPPVATVLYYGAIVAARIRHGELISGLTEEELLSGLAWALRLRWIDEQTRRLFQLGLDILTAR